MTAKSETELLEAESRAAASWKAVGDSLALSVNPLDGLSPRAIEVFEADYKNSQHRRPKCSKSDFAAGWRTAMELHGGVIWKTLNRGAQ